MVTQQLLNSWLAVIAMPSSPAFLSMAVIRALTSVTRARSPNAPQSATLRSLECDCAPQKKPSPQSVLLGSQSVLVMDHVSSSPSGNSLFPLLPAATLSMGLTLKPP